ALEREAVLRPRLEEDLEALRVALDVLEQVDVRRLVQPRVPAPDADVEPPVEEDVRLGDDSREHHRVVEWEGVAERAEPGVSGALGERAEDTEGKHVERELLEERVLEAGERAVPELVRLDSDLDHVPDQLRVIAAGRTLELGVRSVPKRHRQLLPLAVRD